jgi:hypothetical protein
MRLCARGLRRAGRATNFYTKDPRVTQEETPWLSQLSTVICAPFERG